MQQWAIILLLALAACGDNEEGPADRLVPARPVGAILSDTAVGAAAGTWKAVQRPFEDVGIKRDEIPPKLQALVKNPYKISKPIKCAELYKEIEELNMLLGPDVCTPENPTGAVSSRKGEYVEVGAGIAREQAVGMVSGYLDVIPFRGVIRGISGADRHAKDVARAYEAGRSRRSFLRGLAYTCQPTLCFIPTPKTLYLTMFKSTRPCQQMAVTFRLI